MKKLVVFSGAGMSAESGINTFRDSNGLWEQYRIEEVATPEAWSKNPELVQRFYNERRKNILDAEPNAAHQAIASLEDNFNVEVITQNIDDLHERAESKRVLHLHGNIRLAKHQARTRNILKSFIRLTAGSLTSSNINVGKVILYGPMWSGLVKLCLLMNRPLNLQDRLIFLL